ncbi:MAG: methyltransferase domain-containing protein [Candidatus Latescibacteria bacterium]|jgi:ubiquinone/menaquinone biosynthesis C-methylase UbiE|nr:methyltransferase domain-containing protein [Candidatus Latescibacterota bacterium]
MFNNFVNIHDLSTIIKHSSKVFSRITPKQILSKQERVKGAWAHTYNPIRNWWDIPAVKVRWNRLISGDPQVDYYEYISRKYFVNKNSLLALSLGCGTGHRELRWAEQGNFSCIDAYDLSELRIKNAINTVNQKGFGNIINYHVGNVYRIEMRENHYDVILGEQSLHHFSPLEEFLLRINKFLKPDGYFVVNEFVGPTRFQWTDRQLEAVNGLLSILPARFKTMWDSDSIKTNMFKPGRLRMILSDPSEAVESSSIEPLLHKIFEVVEVREYGGTILQLLFKGIAHNFISEDAEAQRWLDICFEVEDQLLASRDIQSDFILAVCKKRTL